MVKEVKVCYFYLSSLKFQLVYLCVGAVRYKSPLWDWWRTREGEKGTDPEAFGCQVVESHTRLPFGTVFTDTSTLSLGSVVEGTGLLGRGVVVPKPETSDPAVSLLWCPLTALGGRATQRVSFPTYETLVLPGTPSTLNNYYPVTQSGPTLVSVLYHYPSVPSLESFVSYKNNYTDTCPRTPVSF